MNSQIIQRIFLSLTLLISLESCKVYATYIGTIRNNSNADWEFTFDHTTGVYIQQEGYICMEPCITTIPAHQKVTVYYNEMSGNSDNNTTFTAGKITIKDKKGTEKLFSYMGHLKSPKIISSSKPSNISLNDPFDGDFTIEKDTW